MRKKGLFINRKKSLCIMSKNITVFLEFFLVHEPLFCPAVSLIFLWKPSWQWSVMPYLSTLFIESFISYLLVFISNVFVWHSIFCAIPWQHLLCIFHGFENSIGHPHLYFLYFSLWMTSFADATNTSLRIFHFESYYISCWLY